MKDDRHHTLSIEIVTRRAFQEACHLSHQQFITAVEEKIPGFSIKAPLIKSAAMSHTFPSNAVHLMIIDDYQILALPRCYEGGRKRQIENNDENVFNQKHQ